VSNKYLLSATRSELYPSHQIFLGTLLAFLTPLNLYPAQQDNFDTSLSNVRAANFNPSAIVK